MLIAAILSDQDFNTSSKLPTPQRWQLWIEVHTLAESVLSLDGVTLVGINNRNLEDFSVDLQTYLLSFFSSTGSAIAGSGYSRCQ